MMTTEKPPTNDDEFPSIDEAEVRKKAVKRAWICPGAGFAFVGSTTYATATFVVSLSVLPCIVWFEFQPAAASFWTTAAVTVIATFLGLAEQIASRKTNVRPAGPSFLVRGFIATSCVWWVGVVLCTGLFVAAFGSLRMVGSGMTPTLEYRERLIYHKFVDWQSVASGAIIVYRNSSDSAWGQPGWLVIGRILAGPGDNISILNERYVVNGAIGPPVADTGNYAPVLDIPDSPESLTIPEGRYFMAQDSPTGGFDSRVLSWVRIDDIVGSRLWYLSSRGFLKAVE